MWRFYVEGSLIPFDASVYPEISSQLLAMESSFRTKAESIVGGAGNGYTGPQLKAMVLFEELKLVSDMELAAVILRGFILQEIEKDASWSEHPEGFKSLKEAAQAFGTSISMLSDTKSLYDIIFPAMSALGYSIPKLWEDIGKSNFRAIVPVLRAIISGEKSKSKEVNEMLDKIWEEVDKGGDYDTDVDRKKAAIDNVIDAAQNTSSELGKALGRMTVNSLILSYGERFFLLTAMSSDEKDMMLKRFGRFMDVRFVNGGEYKLEDIPEVRQLLEAGGVDD
jgi:hypothetical protein